MFTVILKKELRNYFSNMGNIIFVFALPFLLILLMSNALKSYMATDYGTFKDGKVFYYEEEVSEKSVTYIEAFKDVLDESTDVEWIKVDDYELGKRHVEESKAYGIIKVKDNEITYYRSPHNEPVGGQLVRSIFTETIGKKISTQNTQIVKQFIDVPKMDSNAYYTFSNLAFIMMYIALMIAHSIIDERRFGTIERIIMARSGIGTLLLSKIILGILIGILQILTVYLLSSIFLGVNWGLLTPFMFLVLLCIAIFSSTFGAVIGMVVKTKSISDSIILMSAILIGILGGALTPRYLMENNIILKHMVKISPLYWSGKSLGDLQRGVLGRNTFTSIMICLALTTVFVFIYKKVSKKVKLRIEAS